MHAESNTDLRNPLKAVGLVLVVVVVGWWWRWWVGWVRLTWLAEKANNMSTGGRCARSTATSIWGAGAAPRSVYRALSSGVGLNKWMASGRFLLIRLCVSVWRPGGQLALCSGLPGRGGDLGGAYTIAYTSRRTHGQCAM